MPTENGQNPNVSITISNSVSNTPNSVPSVSQQMLQTASLETTANVIQSSNKKSHTQLSRHSLANQQPQILPRTHSASPALRAAVSETNTDPDVQQTMTENAPTSQRTFNHLLLSRPIKSEATDEDDITIVGQTMAHPGPPQVRFIQPTMPQQVLTSSAPGVVNTHILARQPVVQTGPIFQQQGQAIPQQPPPAHRMTASTTQPNAIVGQHQLASAVHIRPPVSAPRAIAPGPPNNNVIRLVRTQPGSSISMVRSATSTIPSHSVPGKQNVGPQAILPQSQGQQPPLQQLQHHQILQTAGAGHVIQQQPQQQPQTHSLPVRGVSHAPHPTVPRISSATAAVSGPGNPNTTTAGNSSAGGGNAATTGNASGSGSTSGDNSGTSNTSSTDHFPGVTTRLTPSDRLVELLTQAHRYLDNRAVLNHDGLVEPHNAERLFSSIPNSDGLSNAVLQKEGGPFRCVECVDTFSLQDSYDAHRERNSVDIMYDCDHCERVRTFGNKCALFSHVRGHRKGSIDPTRLKIRAVLHGRRHNNTASSRRRTDELKTKLEQFMTEFRKRTQLNSNNEDELKQVIAVIQDVKDSLKSSAPRVPSESPEIVETNQECATAQSRKKDAVNGKDVEGDKDFAVAVGGTEECALKNNCIFCKQSFRTKAALRKHFVGSEVSSGRSEASDRSSNAAGGGGAATGGTNQNSSSVQVNCPLCRMMVHSGASLCALKAHLLFHIDMGRVCPDCGFVASDQDDLSAEVTMRKHLHSECLHFQQVYVNLCTFCPEEEQRAYHNPSQLAGHVKSSHARRLFSCNVCSTTFETEYAWHRHLVTAHQVQASNENRRIIYQCPVCQKEIPQSENVPSRADAVRTHIERHCTENEHSLTEAYRCFMQCKQIFYDQGSLRDHMRNCTHFNCMPPVSSNKLPCLLCLRANSNHLRSGDRSVNQIPRQIFSILSLLRNHERSHLRWTPLSNGPATTLQCPWCRADLNLVNRSESENHLLSHGKAVLTAIMAEAAHDDAPNPPSAHITCHCGLQINSSSDLSSHFHASSHAVLSEEQRNAGVQPAPCSECGRKFQRFSQLATHIFTEHRKLCYFCNTFRADSRWDLPSHLWSCLAHGPRIGGGGTQLVEPMTQRSSHDCFRCAESFYSVAELNDHLLKQHGMEPRYACLLCEMLFTRAEALKQHTQIVHAQSVMGGAGLLRCWHCPKKFDKRSTLERHVISAHKVLKQDMESNRALKRERMDEEEALLEKGPDVKRVRVMQQDGKFTDKYECAKCVFTVSTRSAFLLHIREQHQPEEEFKDEFVQCPECGLSFQTAMPFSIHLTAVHKIPRTETNAYLLEHADEINGTSKLELEKEEREPSKVDTPAVSVNKADEQSKEGQNNEQKTDKTNDKRDETQGTPGSTSKLACCECKFEAESLEQLKKHERSHGMLFLKNSSTQNTKKGSSSEQLETVSQGKTSTR